MPSERVTIIVDARDRFSTTLACLRTIQASTPEPHDLLVVMGGAPEHLKRQWREAFGHTARFIFRPHFLNQAQARNIALREVATRLAVVMDSDNFVRPGWLSALVRCQQETGAVMVVPLILEAPRKIHTAGNDLYITYEQGKGFGHKELRFGGMTFGEGTNLTRRRTDYGELHCQLVEVEPTLRLGAYDEQILEVGEVDSGLTWAKAGREMWFEPSAVVYYAIRTPLTADDIRLFAWRWNLRGVLKGYRYFQTKWGFDISEHGTFRDFLMVYNNQLGLLPRLFPSALALLLDRKLGGLRRLCLRPFRLAKQQFRRAKRRAMGYDEWVTT